MNKIIFAGVLVGVWGFDSMGYFIMPQIMPPLVLWGLALPAMLLEFWGWSKLYGLVHKRLITRGKNPSA